MQLLEKYKIVVFKGALSLILVLAMLFFVKKENLSAQTNTAVAHVSIAQCVASNTYKAKILLVRKSHSKRNVCLTMVEDSSMVEDGDLHSSNFAISYTLIISLLFVVLLQQILMYLLQQKNKKRRFAFCYTNIIVRSISIYITNRTIRI